VKLKHLDAWNKKRLENALMLSEALQNVGDISPPDSMYNRVARVGAPPPAGVPFVDGREGNPVTGPHDEQDIRTNFHLYVIRTKKRNALLKHLESRGIHCGIHYPVPLHLTPALKFLGYKIGDFPASELRAKTMLTLPMYAELTPRELRHIISSIKEFYS
jgi:dTDP-4-amino-4,6-dideoxygalactose transaminase